MELSNDEIKDNLEKWLEAFEKWLEELESCEKEGHPHAKSGAIVQYRGNLRVLMNCPDCGHSYDRALTSKESKDWYDLLHTPFTKFN